MRRLLVSLSVLPWLAFASPAGAVQTMFDEAGRGQAFANGDSSVFELCTPDQAQCTPLGRPAQRITFDDAWVGRVVVEVAPAGRHATQVYRGRLVAEAPPTVLGTPVLGRRAFGAPGRWSGGFDGDSSLLQLQSCTTGPTPSCRVLVDSLHQEAGHDPLWGLDQDRQLRVVERRVTFGTPHATIGYTYGNAPPMTDLGAAVIESARVTVPRDPAWRDPLPRIRFGIAREGVTVTLARLSSAAPMPRLTATLRIGRRVLRPTCETSFTQAGRGCDLRVRTNAGGRAGLLVRTADGRVVTRRTVRLSARGAP